MFRPNSTLKLIRDKQLAAGSWLQLSSPDAARVLAAQGAMNWLLVDMEHTPVGTSAAAQMLTSISDLSRGRVTPLARVSAGRIELVKQALDCGAQGVIAPMVNSADEARALVSYARFPPEGVRGGGGMWSHYGHGVTRMEYMKRANQEVLVGVQIETVPALEQLDAILDVPGIDLVFVGPNDLHMSLGLPPKFWSDEPAFKEAIGRIMEGCKRRGLPMGTLCPDAAAVKARHADGFNFIGLGSDCHFMLVYAAMQFAEVRGESEPPEGWCNTVRME